MPDPWENSEQFFSFPVDTPRPETAGRRIPRPTPPAPDVLKLREFQAETALRSSQRQADALASEIRKFLQHAEIFSKGGAEAVTTEAITEYLAARRDKGAGQKTLKNILSALSVFCRHLTGRGLLLANPCQRIRLRKPDRPPPAVLTEDQLIAVLAAADAENIWPQVALAAATGCRLSELRRLRWADLDLAGKRLIVRQSKSGRWRAVPLSELALEALARQVQKIPQGFQYVFPMNRASRREGKPRWEDTPVSAWSWCERMRPVMAVVGAAAVLGPKAVGRGWHALRHTWATRLASANVNLEKIAQWIGHTDIRMTRIYMHLGQGYDSDIEAASPKRRDG